MSYTLQPKPQNFSLKNIFFPEKNSFLKKFLIFREMELSGPKIKKVLMFSQKNVFHTFREMELSSPKIKKLLEGAFGA